MDVKSHGDVVYMDMKSHGDEVYMDMRSNGTHMLTTTLTFTLE